MLKRVLSLLLLAAALPACSTLESINPFKEKAGPPLPGKREAVLPPERLIQADPRIANVRIALPRPATNAAWPQSGGYANHAMHHLTLANDPKRAWSVSIGAGSSKRSKVLSQPVVSDGRVFTFDTRGRVRAFEASSGRRLWEANVLPKGEKDGDLGGGVAVEGNRVFVTTGSAEILALEVGTGKILWRQPMGAPARAAPAVSAGRVFAVSVENEVRAFAAENGRRLWTYTGVAESAIILGAASPAVEGGVVVVPLTTGDLVALRVENGRTLWSERLAAARRRDAVKNLSDIRANPVIDRGVVFAISNAGRLAAISLRNGQRLWDVDVGGLQTPWVAGDYVYLVTRDGLLVAVVRDSGRIRWVIRLDRFVDDRDLKNTIEWAGPVLASDRLIIAGSHGEALSVSPYTGEVIGWLPMRKGVSIQPVVANNTIYFLDDGGTLVAMR